MPTILETSEREAAEAEAETGEEEEEEEETPAPAPEPEPEQLGVIGERELKQSERAILAQQKRLAGILGEDYVAHRCVLCAGIGYTPVPPPIGARLLIVATEKGPAFELEPPPPERKLRQAPDKARCEECDGEGMCETGAQTENGWAAPCSKCSGNGWVTVARVEPLVYGGPTYTPPQPQPTAAMLAAQTPDAWGRPAGHQHWGVPPAQIAG